MDSTQQLHRPALRLDVQRRRLDAQREGYAAMAANVRDERKSVFTALVRAFRDIVPGHRRVQPESDPSTAYLAEKT